MTLANFTSGVNTSFSTELNSNFSGALIGYGHALIEDLWNKNDAGLTPYQDPTDIKRDAFSDSTGYLDTVDTGNTTASFLENFYIGGTVGTTETAITVAYSESANLTVSCTANSSGYISSLKFYNGETSLSEYTIEIKEGATTLLTDTGVVLGSGSSKTVNYNYSDYLRPIAAGQSFTIEFTRTSGSGTIYYNSGSYSGTSFDIDSNKLAGADGRVSFTPIDTSSSVIVQTNELTSTGNNINSIGIYAQNANDGTNLITFDASVDGGSTYTTGLSLDRYHSITSTAGNQLIIKFNLPGDTDIKFYGFAIFLGRV